VRWGCAGRTDDLRGGAVHVDTVGFLARYETRVWEVLLAPWKLNMDCKTKTTWRCDMGCAGEAGVRELWGNMRTYSGSRGLLWWQMDSTDRVIFRTS
jgi:hypothetical protein